MMAIPNQFHRVSAVARTRGEAMLLEQDPLKDLIRKRPDIGTVLYRNLCKELANKLHRMNENWSESAAID